MEIAMRRTENSAQRDCEFLLREVCGIGVENQLMFLNESLRGVSNSIISKCELLSNVKIIFNF